MGKEKAEAVLRERFGYDDAKLVSVGAKVGRGHTTRLTAAIVSGGGATPGGGKNAPEGAMEDAAQRQAKVAVAEAVALIAYGADVSAVDTISGETPLHAVAAAGGALSALVPHLIAAGAAIGARGESS